MWTHPQLHWISDSTRTLSFLNGCGWQTVVHSSPVTLIDVLPHSNRPQRHTLPVSCSSAVCRSRLSRELPRPNLCNAVLFWRSLYPSLRRWTVQWHRIEAVCCREPQHIHAVLSRCLQRQEYGLCRQCWMHCQRWRGAERHGTVASPESPTSSRTDLQRRDLRQKSKSVRHGTRGESLGRFFSGTAHSPMRGWSLRIRLPYRRRMKPVASWPGRQICCSWQGTGCSESMCRQMGWGSAFRSQPMRTCCGRFHISRSQLWWGSFRSQTPFEPTSLVLAPCWMTDPRRKWRQRNVLKIGNESKWHIHAQTSKSNINTLCTHTHVQKRVSCCAILKEAITQSDGNCTELCRTPIT